MLPKKVKEEKITDDIYETAKLSINYSKIKSGMTSNIKKKSRYLSGFFMFDNMALIKEINGKYPQYPDTCFIAENATLLGDIVMGEQCSVWYNAVIRGDVHFVKMGNKVNVQDVSVIHCTYLKHPTIIGNNVSIGHNAIVHGCTIHDNVLVGMGAIIMDNCTVNSNVIIAAGAVITQNMVLEANGIYAGIPAKRVKELNASDFAGEIDRISNNYVMYASWQ